MTDEPLQNHDATKSESPASYLDEPKASHDDGHPEASDGHDSNISSTTPLQAEPQSHHRSSTQHHEKRKRSTTDLDHLIMDRWTLEVIGTTLSLCCLAAMIIVMIVAQSRPLSSWPSSITPNTLIAVFSTLSRSATILAISPALSQLKWLHYTRLARPLADIEVFDEASRGPFGATKFIVNMKQHAPLGTIASLTVIAALAFEPMTQSIFAYYSKGTIDSNSRSYLPVAQIYDSGYSW